MTIRLLMFLFIIVVSGCAPMPGNTLFEGLDHPTAIEDIEDLEVHYGFWATTSFYNQALYKDGQYGFIVANLLLNAGWFIGCADVQWTDGNINKCHIYLSFESDYFLEHEMRHCMGYSDVLY